MNIHSFSGTNTDIFFSYHSAWTVNVILIKTSSPVNAVGLCYPSLTTLRSVCSLGSDESIEPHAEREQLVLGESAVISLLRCWRHKLVCESTTVGKCEHLSAVGETQRETPVLMKSFSTDSHL